MNRKLTKSLLYFRSAVSLFFVLAPTSCTTPPKVQVKTTEDDYNFGSLSQPEASQADAKLVRFAFHHLNWHKKSASDLLLSLSDTKNPAGNAVAETMQRVKPQVVVLSGIDIDSQELTVSKFLNGFVKIGQSGLAGINFAHIYIAKSNSAPKSVFIASKFPILQDKIRTFKNFVWEDYPESRIPKDLKMPRNRKTAIQFEYEKQKNGMKLFSSNFIDVPIVIQDQTIHILSLMVAPTELENGTPTSILQYQDEIRFLRQYLNPEESAQFKDDKGIKGGLSKDDYFVIAADLKMDPMDGPGQKDELTKLLDMGTLNANILPTANGASEDSLLLSGRNAFHIGAPATDTSSFPAETMGNLRTSYLLPSANLLIENSGIFWPDTNHPLRRLIDSAKISNRRMVYVDLLIPKEKKKE